MSQRTRSLVIAIPMLVLVGILWITLHGTPAGTKQAPGGSTSAAGATASGQHTPVVNTPATLPTPVAGTGAQNTVLNPVGEASASGSSATDIGMTGNNGADTSRGHGSSPDPSSSSPSLTPTPVPTVVITPPPYVGPPPITYPSSPSSPASPASPASPSRPSSPGSH